MADGAVLAAVQPGGASSNFLGPDRLDVRLDFGTLAEAGSMLGSGALVVMAEGTDLLAAATNVLRFFRDESCGKCVPCRVGLDQGAHPPREALAAGDGRGRRACGSGCWTSRWCCAGPPSAGSARWPSAPSSACWEPTAARRWRAPSRAAEGHRMPGHEFFTTLTVAQALHGFRPGRRTAAETVALADALHRVPAEAVTATSALPGFARATVDGFAVRAADTYGVSDGQPGYLDVNGAVAMGRAPDGHRRPRHGGGRADGRRAAAGGRRGRHGRAHPGGDAGHDRGGARRSRPATGWSAPTRTPHRARCSRRPGGPCVPMTSACSRPRA